MKSVWHEIGLRNGVFRGTVPAAFMNNAYRFFLDLRDQCRKCCMPTYVPPDYEKNFTFNARDKFGHWRGYDRDLYEEHFTYQAAPIGNPIPEELWNAERPEWEKSFFSESEILGEEIITHPLLYYPSGVARCAMSTEWETQRYRLITKMRYCLVPLKVDIFQPRRYDYKDGYWREWYGNTGCLNQESFAWSANPRLRVTFPDYWSPEGTVYKIGLYALDHGTFGAVPLNGCRWITQKTFSTPLGPDDRPWPGVSTLRIYGAVDLATHPDFSKYFDTGSTEA